MKSATAPAKAAAGNATPELFAHQWDERGLCENPERFAVDGMPKDMSAVFLLGMGPDNLWRVMWRGDKGATTIGLDSLSLDHNPRATRAEALEFGLLTVARALFPKDKRVQKIFGAIVEKLQAAGSPANKADDSKVPTPEPAEIAVEAIEGNPLNERERPKEYIDELAESIEREGLLQRIGVKLLPPSDAGELKGVPPAPRYKLIYGGCRLKAVRQLKQKTIRAEVYPVELTARQEWRLIKVENLKRRNPNPVEEAQGYADHMREFNLTQEEMAKEVGKSRPVIANSVRLLELPESVRELLAGGALSLAHGTALCRFKAWPKVCEKIADLAVKHKTPAGELEKNLPFAEELADAGLAVDVFESVYCGWLSESELKKRVPQDPAIFAWSDRENWDVFVFCLDVKRGKELIEAEKKKKEACEKREENSRAADSEKRDSSGELTPAAKRARQKKIDDNLSNRLQTSALHHAVILRLKSVDALDVTSLLVVANEALRHAGDAEEVAADLGIKLPKNFNVAHCDDDFTGYEGMKPCDVLRLAAACIARRDTEERMRFPHGPHETVQMLSREKPTDKVDASGLVVKHKTKVKELVGAGKRWDAIQQDLGIPEFLAVNLSRTVKREARATAATPAVSAANKSSPAKAKKKGGK